MANLAPYDLISAHAWRRAVFTTYALSLSFFEAVILDALTRGRGQDATIFSDIDGVRAALGEQGARRAGRDYQIEPFVVDRGVFHPKVTALTGDGDNHLLVGSGNLTFGGWGGNLEVLEHLHPSFAADAFHDAAQFFELLASREGIRHGAQQTCDAISQDLLAAARSGSPNGSVRLLHSLDGGISTKLGELVDGLGGATRLVVASPFWSDGALDHLCTVLRLDHAYVHSHNFKTVRGHLGINWPVGTKSEVRPVNAEPIMDLEAKRPLHAKVFEVVCKKGRIILSGSANATIAALGANNNVEACVARIQRDTVVGWSLETASPLELQTDQSELEDAEILTGVLRATLIAEEIVANILQPTMAGPADVFQITAEGPVSLGTVHVDPTGSFKVLAPNLEILSWRGGRLIIRVEQDGGKCAEGFITVSSYSEIRRRVGALAPRLFALLSGTETPADVAAIMSWFHEDPQRMLARAPLKAAGNLLDSPPSKEAFAFVTDLGSVAPNAYRGDFLHSDTGTASWKRFMDNVFAAFRTQREAFGVRAGETSEDDDEETPPTETKVDPAIARSIVVFDKLLDLLLSPQNAPAYAVMAFDMAQYVSGRLEPEPERIRSWLNRLTKEFVVHGVPEDRLEDVAAAILTICGISSETAEDDRAARLRLLRLGVNLEGNVPDISGVQVFSEALGASVNYQKLWDRLQGVRSLPEQATAYLSAFKSREASGGYLDLATLAIEAWPILEGAITDDDLRSQILILEQPVRACPRCHRVLPTGDIATLADIRIVVARGCCQRILVCEGL